MIYDEATWQSIDGIPLFARCWRPDGTPRAVVCLLHGLGEHSARYAGLATVLANAGFAVQGFDLRGHGRSGGLRGHAPSFDRLLDDATLLLTMAARAFPGLPQFLYGHSMGGTLALICLLRRRLVLAGIVASAPALRLAVPPSPWKLALGLACYRLWPTLRLNNGLDSCACANCDDPARRGRQDPLCHSLVSARLGLDLLRNGLQVLEHGGECLLPLLVLQGDHDRVVNIDTCRRFTEQAGGDYRLFPDCGHELHNEQQRQQVFDVLLAWLRARLAGAPRQV